MDKEIILDFICYGKHMVVVKLEMEHMLCI